MGRIGTEDFNLVRLGNIHLIRTKMMKLNLNPYLSENLEYYQALKTDRVLTRLSGQLYKKYKHLCTVCGESLHNGERVEIHHIKPVREGGGEGYDEEPTTAALDLPHPNDPSEKGIV